MKVLVISDSHRNNERVREVIEKEKPFDRLIHCGDSEGAAYLIEKMAECPIDIVLGNNDFFDELPREKEVLIGDKRALVTHGHYYYVSMGPERIVDEAVARGMDMVIFGHTHKPVVAEHRGVIVLNPGSIAYPRQEGRKCSYIVMQVNEGQEMEMEIEVRYL